MSSITADRPQHSRGSRRGWLSLLGLATLVAGWSVLAGMYPPILVPSPLEVLQALLQLARQGALWREISLTIVRLVAAFGLGAFLGIALGLLAGRAEAVAQLLKPLMNVAAGVPPIAWVALALIWFGTGSLTPIFVALLVTTPVLFAATLEGVRALDQDLLAMTRVFGLRGARLLREFYLPALAPHLLSGSTVGATLTVRVGVMGEFLASNSGIGSAMALARTRLDTAEVLAWVAVALGLLFVVEGLVLRPLGRRAAGWRRES
jgi:NitT/TauT family transport system permease protein